MKVKAFEAQRNKKGLLDATPVYDTISALRP